jgi:anti-sigma factor RsiW
MTCDDVRPRLTAYLDGELDVDRGTVVRGHLRTCAACRDVASAEAALRDGLRALPTVDPPSRLWAGVQARLAAAEIADAERPAWRRTIARWSAMVATPRFAVAGVVAVAAIAVLVWRMQRDEAAQVVVKSHPIPEFAPHQEPVPAPVPVPRPASEEDVTADLAAEPARVTQLYADTANELLALAVEAKQRWTTEQQNTFDHKVRGLKERIATAEEGKPRQRAWRALIGYLRTAITRDEVAHASGATR